MRQLWRLIAFVFVVVSSSAAIADDVRVIDGDTIAIGKTHYRLLGIAAPDVPVTVAVCARNSAGMASRDREKRYRIRGGPGKLTGMPGTYYLCLLRP